MKKFFLILLPILILSSGCKDDPAFVSISVNPMINGTDWVQFEPYTYDENADYRFERVKFYVSNPTFIKKNGDEVVVDDVFIFDSNSDDKWVLSIPEGNYNGFKFDIGIPEDQNLGNPADYGDDHPLSLRQGMHWSWATGYIFMRIDGDMDTTGNDTFDHPLVFHAGTNELAKTVDYSDSSFSIEATDGLEINFNLHFDKIFKNGVNDIDLWTDHFTHTTGGEYAKNLADQAISNLVNHALEKEPF
jgi:hypothetical protein